MSVGMQKTEIRVKPGSETRAFDSTVQHTIEVVECGIELVLCRLSATLGEAVLFGQRVCHSAPIDPCDTVLWCYGVDVLRCYGIDLNTSTHDNTVTHQHVNTNQSGMSKNFSGFETCLL